MDAETKLLLFIAFCLSVTATNAAADPTYIAFWLSMKGMQGKSVWNTDPEADTTEAKIVLNTTMLSGVSCAGECLKMYQQSKSTEGCTGYNYNGDDILSPGRCILISAFDGSEIGTYNRSDPDWSYYDLECPNGKPKETFCGDEEGDEDDE